MSIANSNLLPSQHSAIVGVINPDLQTAGVKTTAWMDMAQFEALMCVIMAGALGANATIDAKLQQATDAAGTGAKDITGKAITQLTKAGTDDNKQAVINVAASDLDISNDFSHVQLSMTVAVASSDAGAAVFGHFPHYGPASDNQAATVAEIIE